MYGAIPDVVISKPPRNNQFRVVVALVLGVMIGALGTASMLFPVATKITEAPTPAPRPVTPILAADPEIEMSDDLMECKKQLKGVEKQAGSCSAPRETVVCVRIDRRTTAKPGFGVSSTPPIHHPLS